MKDIKFITIGVIIVVLAILLFVTLRSASVAEATYSCEYEEPKECIPYNQAWVLAEDEEYCEEPEVTSTPTESPEEPGLPGNPPTFAGSTTNAPGVCTATIPNNPANPLVWRKGGSAIVQWIPDNTANKAHIYWRINGQMTWMYALITDNSGYVVINDLGTNDVTFGVAQANDCNESQIITIVDSASEGYILFTP